MKFLHISDLHLGKRIYALSMLDDQAFVLDQVVGLAEKEQPDAILIAGDIYDKPVPPAEAVGLLDGFLVRLAEMKIPVFIISGNHDSVERVAFASHLIAQSGVYLSPVYDGAVQPITLYDAFGPVDLFLLPFLKPAHVRRYYPEEPIETYTDAMACAIAHMSIDPSRRSVLLAHQFVTGATRSESEEISIGGLDCVDASVFSPFCYVALGHLHRAQSIGENIHYSGTLLKYDFSEAKQEKSVTIAELDAQGKRILRTIPLTPLHDLLELRGTYMQLTARSFYQGMNRESYVHITLTDEEDIPEAIGKLRVVYPNLLKMDYDNCRTRSNHLIAQTEITSMHTPMELFQGLYQLQNNQPFTKEQQAYLNELIEEIWEEKT